MKRPLVFLCAVALFATLGFVSGIGFALLSCGAFLGLLFFLYRKNRSVDRLLVCFLAIGTVLLSFYPLCYTSIAHARDTRFCENSLSSPSMLSPSDSLPCFSGQVIAVSSGEQQTAVSVRLSDRRFFAQKCTFTVDSNHSVPALFDNIAFCGSLRPLSDGNRPDAFSLSRYADGIRLVADVSDFEILSSVAPLGLRARIARHLSSSFSAMCDGDTASLLLALTVGDRSGISTERQALFARAGVYPYLCISGLHVMLCAGSFRELVSRLHLPKLLQLLLSGAFLVLIGIIGGASGSVLRACIMAAILWAAPLVRRNYDSLSALAAAFLLLWLQNPYMLFDLGTQLSFVATAGLALAADMRRDLPASLTKSRSIFFALCGSLYATGFTALLCTRATGYFCLLAPFSNLFAGAIFTPAMYLLLLSALLSAPFPFFAAILARGAQAFLKLFEAIASLFAACSGGVLAFEQASISPPVIGLFLIPLVLLLLTSIRENDEKQARAAFLTAVSPYPMLAIVGLFAALG